MATPIGKQLEHARLARGLTLDDIEHHTRIPKSLVAAMEGDDLSAFANQTYARKFFDAYARHLGIDTGPVIQRFHPHGLAGIVRYHPYLQPPTDQITPADSRSRAHSRYASAPLYVGLIALALAIGLALWSGRRDRPVAAPAHSSLQP